MTRPHTTQIQLDGREAALAADNRALYLWTFGGAGSGTFLTPQIAAMNQMIAAMNQMIADLDAAASINTGYTIQTVDLSAYPSFA